MIGSGLRNRPEARVVHPPVHVDQSGAVQVLVPRESRATLARRGRSAGLRSPLWSVAPSSRSCAAPRRGRGRAPPASAPASLVTASTEPRWSRCDVLEHRCRSVGIMPAEVVLTCTTESPMRVRSTVLAAHRHRLLVRAGVVLARCLHRRRAAGLDRPLALLEVARPVRAVAEAVARRPRRVGPALAHRHLLGEPARVPVDERVVHIGAGVVLVAFVRVLALVPLDVAAGVVRERVRHLADGGGGEPVRRRPDRRSSRLSSADTSLVLVVRLPRRS